MRMWLWMLRCRGGVTILCMQHVDQEPNYSTANQLVVDATTTWQLINEIMQMQNYTDENDQMVPNHASAIFYKYLLTHTLNKFHRINVQEQRKAEVEHLNLRSRVGKLTTKIDMRTQLNVTMKNE